MGKYSLYKDSKGVYHVIHGFIVRTESLTSTRPHQYFTGVSLSPLIDDAKVFRTKKGAMRAWQIASNAEPGTSSVAGITVSVTVIPVKLEALAT